MRNSKNPPTVVFTGGHHNSALVVALALKAKGVNIAWLGHKFTIQGDKAISAEYQEVIGHKIPFYELKTGKFYRKKNPLEFLKIATGFLQSFIYLLTIRPNLIVSFGGYLAVPVVITGWLLRIPSVTHEQTVTGGWANKAITPFVKKIFLTHQSSLKSYPKEKAIVTGLPLQPSFFEPPIHKKKKRKTIFITCGKQGSHIINSNLFPIIPKLVEKYKVIHQTGVHTTTPDQDRARRVKMALPKELQSRYRHQPYYFGKEAVKYLYLADLTISRAGAHTVYELLYLNKKHIVIPIPWVSHNEQLENANLLAKYTATKILQEKDLTPDSLLQSIEEVIHKSKKDKQPPVITNATERILTQLLAYLS